MRFQRPRRLDTIDIRVLIEGSRLRNIAGISSNARGRYYISERGLKSGIDGVILYRAIHSCPSFQRAAVIFIRRNIDARIP